MRAVEPTFDLGTSAPQPHADLLTPQTPALPLPADRVVRSDRARHPYAENLLQVLGALYTAVRVAALRVLYTEALAPEWPESDFQKTIGLFPRADFAPDGFFHQPVLQHAEQSLNTPFGLRTVGGDPFHI